MGLNPQDNLKYNLTRKFPVESECNYVVRMHFCETEVFVNSAVQQVLFVAYPNLFNAFNRCYIRTHVKYIQGIKEVTLRNPPGRALFGSHNMLGRKQLCHYEKDESETQQA
ncbi:hypothetical protein M5689_007433 [Euphorbia peplus]|nr:hypothetical protein M5689_007433 [Euphorbia peplus]